MRRHAEQRADRHDARPADAGDHDVERAVRKRREYGFGKIGLRLARKRRNLGLARLGVEHGDEAGAEAFDAAIILVAVRLVDLALAAKLGFLGPDAHAIRLDRTGRSEEHTYELQSLMRISY